MREHCFLMLASLPSAFHLYHITAAALNIRSLSNRYFPGMTHDGWSEEQRCNHSRSARVFEKHGTRLQSSVCHGTLGITEKPSEKSAMRPREAAISLLLQPFETIRSNRMSGIILLWGFIKGPRQTQNNTLHNKGLFPVIPSNHVCFKEKYIELENVYIILLACKS